MDLYEDFIDDTMSVKSNKIIKPLKGGLQFHWSQSMRCLDVYDKLSIILL